MAATEADEGGNTTPQSIMWQSSDSDIESIPPINGKTLLCRRMSSSSESGFESGFHSDLSDELGSSQPSTSDCINGLSSACSNGDNLIDASQKEVEEVKRVICQLAFDVVNHMTESSTRRASSPYSATILHVVDDLSVRHEIVFEGIVGRLGVTESMDTSTCQRMITGVGNELFADGQYNWGRVVTLFAFAGWLARSCSRKARFAKYSDAECAQCTATIATVAGDYMANKLSGWICSQGGWDAMEKFFAQPESLESKLWRGLMFTFVGLGVLAAIAAVR